MNSTYYLKHHGIKGQQWGVRNGPPYPIEDKVLKKGTRVNSVSGRFLGTRAYLKSGRPLYTYKADDEWDNKVYKGPFIDHLSNKGIRYVREHEFETTKDLRMANSEERFTEFKKILDNERTAKTAVKDLATVQTALRGINNTADPNWGDMCNLDLNNLKTAKDYQTAYEIFNEAMYFAHKFKTTRAYIKNIAKKYDAMVDDHDVNTYNNAHDPIIFLKPAKFLRDVSDPKNPKYVGAEDVIKNTKDIENELSKNGKELVF